MSEPPVSPLLIAIGAVLELASLATWVYLAYRKRRCCAILDYEPRRPVPWGPMGALLAVLLVLNSVAAAFLTTDATPSVAKDVPAPPSPLPLPEESDSVERMAAMIAFYPLLVGGVLVVVVLYSRATLRDLGLPIGPREFARDVGIGIVACLASLVPVYGILSAVELIFRQEAHHPIVDAVLREANPVVLVLAAVSAVIVAPICEEITFRLLLQGWLEKQMPNDEYGMTNEESADDVHSSSGIRQSAFPIRWLPIGISALLFAVAHVGQGSAPIALFFLALILGYLYQRTHRIVPCITMHAMFNSLSIVGLLLRMMGPGE